MRVRKRLSFLLIVCLSLLLLSACSKNIEEEKDKAMDAAESTFLAIK